MWLMHTNHILASRKPQERERNMRDWNPIHVHAKSILENEREAKRWKKKHIDNHFHVIQKLIDYHFYAAFRVSSLFFPFSFFLCFFLLLSFSACLWSLKTTSPSRICISIRVIERFKKRIHEITGKSNAFTYMQHQIIIVFRFILCVCNRRWCFVCRCAAL